MPDLKTRFRGADRIPAPHLWEEIGAREPSLYPPEPRPTRRIIVSAFALLVAVAGVGFAVRGLSSHRQPTSASSPSVAPKANGLIYFQVGGGEGGTWTDAIEPDGSGRHNIFGPESYYSNIAWSPDGSMITYVGIEQYAQQSSDGQVHFGIYTANPDGSNRHLLAEGLNEGWPSLSHDGTQIAFSSTGADPSVKNCEPGGDPSCPTDIYLMNADGTGITRVTDDSAPEYAPAWSPDGTSIAFVRGQGGTEAIDIVNVDGTDLREVATGTGGNQRPFAWGPDGRRIAFVRMGKASWDIGVVNTDGTAMKTIFSRDGVWSEGPAWSPDGTQIAFSSTLGAYPPGCGEYSDGCSDLFVMNSDGSGIRRLTQDAAGVGDIAWQPLSAGAVIRVTSPSTQEAPEAVTATVADRVRLAGLPGAVAAADGSVWVATYDFERGRGAIVHIDAATDQIVARVPVGEAVVYNLAASPTAAWAPVGPIGKGSALLRIDAGTNEVTGRVNGVTGPVVVAPGGVWAVEAGAGGRDATVVQIDPSTLQIERRVPVGQVPLDMAAGSGSIWVQTRTLTEGVTSSGPLLRIDAGTGSVTTIDLNGSGIWIAADDAGAWIAASAPSNNSVAEFIDASTDAPSGEPGPVYNFRPFAVAEDRVWFISGPGDRDLPKGGICGLNAVTRKVDACADPGSIADLELAHDPAAFESSTQSIWVGAYEKPWMTRIDINRMT